MKRVDLIEAMHRSVTGQASTPWQLVVGGVFVIVWFLMDLHEYISFLSGGCS